MLMRLANYLEEQNLSIGDFAAQLGVAYQTIHRYVRGERRPQWSLLQRITKETGGAVQPNDFFEVTYDVTAPPGAPARGHGGAATRHRAGSGRDAPSPIAPHALLHVDEMAAADAAAIAGGVPGEVLMENAGAAVAREIRRRWPPLRVAVLCGPGNNGGDGFVVARHLAEAGFEVCVALLGERGKLKGDAAVMAERWHGPVAPLDSGGTTGCDLVVDAIFGAGLSRDVTGVGAMIVRQANEAGVPVVAIDVPSGVDGDTGEIRGAAFQAALSVTFFRRKPGHLLVPGRRLAGETVVADIGIPDGALSAIAPQLNENHPDLWMARFPWPSLEGHKYVRGHAIVVSGDASHTGAARLGARAALRTGAGLVTVASPPDALSINAAQLTAVMCTSFEGVAGFADVLGDPRRNVVLLGPGNGVTEATRANVLAALGAGKACVLDADALSVFAAAPAELFGAMAGRSCLLTPHEGEFRRLFGSAVGAGGGKVARARAAARLSGATVLLKGADTVVAAPDGRAVINANAPPELATAGSGDTLAGIALGLMAQGLDPFEAGSAAAWLHGAAAGEVGPGLIADDLAEALPAVLKRLKSRDAERAAREFAMMAG